MKPKQVFDTLEAFALLVKEIHALRESNNQLNDYVSSLEQVREENESLKEENKGLKRDVCKLNEFIDNNVEVLRQENKLLKEDRDELLKQLKKETAPFEKQVTRLMLENRRLTKQLEESYELHALKRELQKELKEQTDISPKLETKAVGNLKLANVWLKNEGILSEKVTGNSNPHKIPD